MWPLPHDVGTRRYCVKTDVKFIFCQISWEIQPEAHWGTPLIFFQRIRQRRRVLLSGVLIYCPFCLQRAAPVSQRCVLCGHAAMHHDPRKGALSIQAESDRYRCHFRWLAPRHQEDTLGLGAPCPGRLKRHQKHLKKPTWQESFPPRSQCNCPPRPPPPPNPALRTRGTADAVWASWNGHRSQTFESLGEQGLT
jgi:hypothetical protein